MLLIGDRVAAKKNPEMGDGLYHGPSRGHVQPVYARLIGMPRGYGYGSTMGGWVLDYIENWAGEHGYVRHTWIQYRNPAFTGDVTYIEGRVGEKRVDPQTGWQLVTIHVTMKTHKGAQMARGYVDLELADPHRVYVDGPTRWKAADMVCPSGIRPAVMILIGTLAAPGVSMLRNVYTINRGYEDLAERLNSLGAHITVLHQI